MINENLKQRSRGFPLDLMNLVETLPRDWVSDILGRRPLRSAASVGACYRSATRARSAPDFIAKTGLVEEESDESVCWTHLLQAGGRVSSEITSPIFRESGELTAIAIPSSRIARHTVSASKPDESARSVPRSALRAPRSP